jgi:quinolinate synthase
MVDFAQRSDKSRFLVATETGILHRLNKEVPGKRFEPVNENAICVFMKMITLTKVRDALRDWQFEVTVEPEIAARARGAIDRMVALGSTFAA